MPASSWNDRSGAIAAGGVAQDISPDGFIRHGFMIQNPHASEEMWFNVGVTAVQAPPSIRIVAGGLYESPPKASPQGRISVIATTIAHTYTAKEW